jgi:hypothetical protein
LHVWQQHKVPQQQIAPAYPPFLRNYGSASRASCRAEFAVLQRMAALPVLPARNYGCNFAHSAHWGVAKIADSHSSQNAAIGCA